ncbi:ubiquitin carboxyl-terminal hydrolase 9-like [Iris pallida]|uniref:Ubiquitin carboxyl-terminal hydrolase n=1 Tax=Iris pallida TaxID=29817 RepID=A0AAX6I9W7_IRIPA|nr:ubiquitin carboxyl-terminal hydrolase 9-like [Iris pallida]KAJ6849554.1 ubiquitin carboxyl-terminal hydrolase 9-like [Iris pallida]
MTIQNTEGFSPAENSLPCTPEEEKETVLELTRAADSNLKDGDLFFLVSARWWRDWQDYVGLDDTNRDFTSLRHSNDGLPHVPCRPGKIDNTSLVSYKTSGDGNDLDLRRNLQEGEDYNLIPQEVWKKLHEWYKGGPELPRRLISEGVIAKSFSVEVYPLCLQLIDARDYSQRIIRISRKASVGELYSKVCTLLQLEKAKVQLYDYFNKNRTILDNLDCTLQEAQLQMDQEILLEIKLDVCGPSKSSMDSTGNDMALVSVEPLRSSITIAGGPSVSNGFSSGIDSSFLQGSTLNSALKDTDDDDVLSNGTKVDGQGLTGLHNLGNTCFMNSALQCLVHTPPLVDFFLQDYSREINSRNPLGMQGELALSFGELLRKLWSSGRTSVAPRAFKAKLARFAPQFSGYNQHDSQELLAFLLDGLHEDLNRVQNKPYIEAKDANGRPEEEFADECWRNHKARNDSIIVDVCQGQYKSTLVCPTCKKVSVTFDPFMYLSLPLPSTITRTMTITVLSGDGSALPMPYTITVQKNGNCKDLIEALNIACCLQSSQTLLVAEVYENRIFRYFEHFESLSSIKDDDRLVAYRLPINHVDFLRLEIMHQRSGRILEPQYNVDQKFLGTPLVTCLAKSATTGMDIQTAVRTVLAPLLRANASATNQNASNDNSVGPSLDSVTVVDNGLPCSIDEDLPTSYMAIDEPILECPSFKLALTDEKGNCRTPLANDSILSPGSCIRVMLEWSDSDHELYNFSFLEDLPEVFKPGYMKKTRQDTVNLFSCLEAFLKEEPLGPDDMWYCPGCKEHRQATKKLDLWRLPDILVVHLKRFSYSRFLKNKLDTFVNFPIHNLDLSKYVKHKAADGSGEESNLYELYAVSNHYGGLGGGHYSAYAKLVEEDSWYHFDDSHVSHVSEDAVRTSAAYVLFYRRVEAQSRMVGVEEPSSSSSTLDAC